LEVLMGGAAILGYVEPGDGLRKDFSQREVQSA
jgi:hypothetical protein